MITYHPRDLLEKAAPDFLVKRLVKKNLTVNRAVLSILTKAEILTKKTLERVALKVLKSYRERYAEERSAGASKAEALTEATNENKLLVQRVQQEVVSEVAGEIKDGYRGERYIWLPSSAETPDPLHQLNYGKKFTVGRGEMPGDRFGCQCGMRILVKEEELEL